MIVTHAMAIPSLIDASIEQLNNEIHCIADGLKFVLALSFMSHHSGEFGLSIVTPRASSAFIALPL